jgi:hypothetical protein
LTFEPRKEILRKEDSLNKWLESNERNEGIYTKLIYNNWCAWKVFLFGRIIKYNIDKTFKNIVVFLQTCIQINIFQHNSCSVPKPPKTIISKKYNFSWIYLIDW